MNQVQYGIVNRRKIITQQLKPGLPPTSVPNSSIYRGAGQLDLKIHYEGVVLKLSRQHMSRQVLLKLYSMLSLAFSSSAKLVATVGDSPG
jgi:hypothetical protein